MKLKLVLIISILVIAVVVVFFGVRYQEQQKYKGTAGLILITNGKFEDVKSNEYVDILKEKLKAQNVSYKWFEFRCNEFWIKQWDVQYMSVERHGYHQDGCPGDPESSPRYDTFLIDKNTKEVFYYNFYPEGTVTLGEWAKQMYK